METLIINYSIKQDLDVLLTIEIGKKLILIKDLCHEQLILRQIDIFFENNADLLLKMSPLPIILITNSNYKSKYILTYTNQSFPTLWHKMMTQSQTVIPNFKIELINENFMANYDAIKEYQIKVAKKNKINKIYTSALSQIMDRL